MVRPIDLSGYDDEQRRGIQPALDLFARVRKAARREAVVFAAQRSIARSAERRRLQAAAMQRLADERRESWLRAEELNQRNEAGR